MEIEQKRREYTAYLNREYSATSFFYLNLFAHNFLLCCDVISLDGITIKFLEEGKIGHSYPAEALKALKHMIVLSALSKIMLLIESFLRMTDALIGDFKKLPSKMLGYYAPRSLDAILDKAKDGKITKEDIWRVFGFPCIEDLSLSEDENKLIGKVLNRAVEQIKTFYERIARFYDDHRIAYNKYKHGLSLLVGLEPTTAILDDPLIVVLDMRKKLDKLRCQFLSGKVTLPDEYKWFNTISVLPVREATFKKHSGVLADLKNCIQAIMDNHFIKGINCGVGYLPKTVQTGKDFPEDILQEFQKIAAEKIAPKMFLMQPPTFKLEVNFEKPLSESLKKKLENEDIANIFLDLDKTSNE